MEAGSCNFPAPGIHDLQPEPAAMEQVPVYRMAHRLGADGSRDVRGRPGTSRSGHRKVERHISDAALVDLRAFRRLSDGVVLALGRRSSAAAIKNLCVLYIELIAWVPLISMLFHGLGDAPPLLSARRVSPSIKS